MRWWLPWVGTGGVALAYLVIGVLLDLRRGFRRGRQHANAERFAVVLWGDDAEAATAAESFPAGMDQYTLAVLQDLSLDFDGDALVRLRTLAGAMGFTEEVTKWARRRSWRRRLRAARLTNLVPAEDPVRARLLADRHHLVRAAAAEALDAGEVVRYADVLVAMLRDPVPSVRFSAEQALLRGQSQVVPTIAAALLEPDLAAWALEIAAFVPDGRLTEHLAPYAHAEVALHRLLLARALEAQPPHFAEPLLRELLADEDSSVRAAALRAVGACGLVELAGLAGTCMRDRSWDVRRAAGLALSVLGDIGLAVLRAHLRDEDTFAADMAKQCLDLIETEHVGPSLRSVLVAS